jgi:hypothetical protein
LAGPDSGESGSGSQFVGGIGSPASLIFIVPVYSKIFLHFVSFREKFAKGFSSGYSRFQAVYQYTVSFYSRSENGSKVEVLVRSCVYNYLLRAGAFSTHRDLRP